MTDLFPLFGNINGAVAGPLPLDLPNVGGGLFVAANDATNNVTKVAYTATIALHKTGGATTGAALGLGGYAEANNVGVWGLTSYSSIAPGANYTGVGLVGAEIGVRNFGTAAGNSAVALAIAGMGNQLLTSAIQIQSNLGGGGTSAQFQNGIVFNNFAKSVIAGSLITGNSGRATNGIDFSAMAFSGYEMLFPSWNVLPGGRLSLLYSGGATSGSVWIGSHQIIGPRDTGWKAMAGAVDKAASLATSSVTLAQLAARVANIQAAMTAHGLIGA